MEFVARVLVQIPAPRRHLVRYDGAYSNAARGKRKKARDVTPSLHQPLRPHPHPRAIRELVARPPGTPR